MNFRNRFLQSALLITLLLALFGCSNSPETATSNPETTTSTTAQTNPSSKEPFLVFFLNPNGGPCRMQDQILADMSDELKGKVNLYYVSTAVQDDMKVFYAYGIRGLPALVLADASGKEIKRLPPGVRSANEIRTLLKALPAG